MVKQRAIYSALAFMLGATTPAAADVVTDWNLIATQAVAAAGAARPGPSGLVDIAMVHIAVHDAVQAYQGRFASYGPAVSPSTGSPVAAVAKAARDVLVGVGLTTANGTSVDTIYDSYLAAQGLVGNAGYLVGQQAAANILTLRVNNDGRVPAGTPPFIGGTGIGEWRPTGLTAAGTPAPMAAPHLGHVLPFALKDATQFRQNPPPKVTSGKYAAEYDEVKALGSLNGSARRPSQTDLALFFADNTPLLWNRGLRAIASSNLTDLGDSARMFALANMAMADAVIASWANKTHYNFWRPITAIRLGDSDGNDATAGDATWTPYITTPAYPDYNSGANMVTSAATTMLADVFGGDKFVFELTSAFVHPVTGEKPTTPRQYTRFSSAAADTEDARIYEGIHFRAADTDGRAQGRNIAHWVYTHFLRGRR